MQQPHWLTDRKLKCHMKHVNHISVPCCHPPTRSNNQNREKQRQHRTDLKKRGCEITRAVCPITTCTLRTRCLRSALLLMAALSDSDFWKPPSASNPARMSSSWDDSWCEVSRRRVWRTESVLAPRWGRVNGPAAVTTHAASLVRQSECRANWPLLLFTPTAVQISELNFVPFDAHTTVSCW